MPSRPAVAIARRFPSLSLILPIDRGIPPRAAASRVSDSCNDSRSSPATKCHRRAIGVEREDELLASPNGIAGLGGLCDATRAERCTSASGRSRAGPQSAHRRGRSARSAAATGRAGRHFSLGRTGGDEASDLVVALSSGARAPRLGLRESRRARERLSADDLPDPLPGEAEPARDLSLGRRRRRPGAESHRRGRMAPGVGPSRVMLPGPRAGSGHDLAPCTGAERPALS